MSMGNWQQLSRGWYVCATIAILDLGIWSPLRGHAIVVTCAAAAGDLLTYFRTLLRSSFPGGIVPVRAPFGAPLRFRSPPLEMSAAQAHHGGCASRLAWRHYMLRHRPLRRTSNSPIGNLLPRFPSGSRTCRSRSRSWWASPDIKPSELARRSDCPSSACCPCVRPTRCMPPPPRWSGPPSQQTERGDLPPSSRSAGGEPRPVPAVGSPGHYCRSDSASLSETTREHGKQWAFNSH